MGLLGLPFPEELGGSGADVVTCCLAGEALGHAGVDGGNLLAWGAHTYLCACNIFSFGTEEQKKKYIPRLASGEWIGCMGLTEPGSGSDAASMRTTAVKKGDKYVLNGSKTFITNAPVADVIVVFATVDRAKSMKELPLLLWKREHRVYQQGNLSTKWAANVLPHRKYSLKIVKFPKKTCSGVKMMDG